MTKINVPDEWNNYAQELVRDLEHLRFIPGYQTLVIDKIEERNKELFVMFYLDEDQDYLYEVIINKIRKAEINMQATSFTKTSNIQGNTGGSRTAF